jgi:hypothetical protein
MVLLQRKNPIPSLKYGFPFHNRRTINWTGAVWQVCSLEKLLSDSWEVWFVRWHSIRTHVLYLASGYWLHKKTKGKRMRIVISLVPNTPSSNADRHRDSFKFEFKYIRSNLGKNRSLRHDSLIKICVKLADSPLSRLSFCLSSYVDIVPHRVYFECTFRNF